MPQAYKNNWIGIEWKRESKQKNKLEDAVVVRKGMVE